MLFVDNPTEFHRILPGFLPGDLRPAPDQGLHSPGDSFGRTLGEALFKGDCPGLMTADQPAGETGGFWESWFLAHRATVSQYDELRKAIDARQDLPGHVVCLALSGSGFHGQQERSWSAEPGNLHLSVGFRCDLAAGPCGLALTMLPAVAVVDALTVLAARCEPTLRTDLTGIKWVNDILIADGKIGGVLTSARSQSGRIGSAVLGIGLNVAVNPVVPRTPFTPKVACLQDHFPLPADGLTVVLRLLLSALENRFVELVREGSDPLLKSYRAASVVMGREVEIRPGGPVAGTTRRGRVLAIGSDLALTLSDGPEPVNEGRLILLP